MDCSRDILHYKLYLCIFPSRKIEIVSVTYYCRAWILHLFGCVLFPDATGDTASWMYLPCLTDWDTAGGYSWASDVLAFLYRHLCEACRRSTQNASIGGCVYLLQLWNTTMKLKIILVYLLVGAWNPRYISTTCCSFSVNQVCKLGQQRETSCKV
jgi:hypothetical protein